MSTLAIKNIGTLVTGDIDNPICEADTVVVEKGKIKEIGNEAILGKFQIDKIIDAKGITVVPGLIDSHVHPVVGDFTPRQNTLGFIESSLHGGVTTMISAGECHTPGRPKDVEGTKALAVLAHKCFENFRPGGVKIHGGALILEKGLTEQDFIELSNQGVWLVGEVGLGSINRPIDAAPMVKLAKKHGFKVMMHTGGTSIPGSSTVMAKDVIEVAPNVVSHLNGGPTAIPLEEVKKLIDETEFILELVQCGNFKVLKEAVQWLADKNELGRIILGNDAPSGTGVIPLGILRTVSFIASVADVPAEKALCMATGNTAKAYDLSTGILEAGKDADMVLMDAPMGSVGDNCLKALGAGDLPGISMVIIDGEIKITASRNTPPPINKATVC